MTAVDPQHSNESGRSNWDIYDDFKLKKTIFDLHGLYINIQRLNHVKG